MVAKIAIYICPVPGCVTIASKASACPGHPNRALLKAVYAHQPKPGATKPGDLGTKSKLPFDLGNYDDILNNLFGGVKK